MISLKDARKLLKQLLSLRGRTLITFHSIADTDAVASALVLRDLLSARGCECDVKAIDCLNAQSRRLLKSLGAREPQALVGLYCDNIVLVDVSNADLLGDWGAAIAGFRGKIIAIDHHYHSKHLRTTYSFIDYGTTSVSEIILALSKLARFKLDKTQAALLFAGIVSDTACFKSANNETIRAANELLAFGGVDFQELLKTLEAKPDVSERMAVVKCVEKTRLERVGDKLIALSTSSAFELQCATALVALGCDYAFVANPKEGRVSGARSDYASGNMGKIMEAVGRVFGGSGGGHEKVGGAKGEPANAQRALEECLQQAKKFL